MMEKRRHKLSTERRERMKQWSRWFAAGLFAAVLSVNAAAVAAEPAEDKRPVRAVRCASAVGG